MEQQDEHEIELRAQKRAAQLLDAALPEIVASSVETAMRRVLSDTSLREDFWKAGYQELEKHAGTNIAQWLGRRLINIIITATVAGVLAWIVMTGKLK